MGNKESNAMDCINENIVSFPKTTTELIWLMELYANDYHKGQHKRVPDNRCVVSNCGLQASSDSVLCYKHK